MIKAVDFIRLAENICNELTRNNINPSDTRYIELYDDWERMTKEGHKYSYIMLYLSEKYEVSERSINRIVKRLGRDIEL